MIRVAPVPLYNSFEDVYTFGQVLRDVLVSGNDERKEKSLQLQAEVQWAHCSPSCWHGTATRSTCSRVGRFTQTNIYQGKSINIALSDRGWHSLDRLALARP